MTFLMAWIALDEVPQGDVTDAQTGFTLMLQYKMRATGNIQKEITI